MPVALQFKAVSLLYYFTTLSGVLIASLTACCLAASVDVDVVCRVLETVTLAMAKDATHIEAVHAMVVAVLTRGAPGLPKIIAVL